MILEKKKRRLVIGSRKIKMFGFNNFVIAFLSLLAITTLSPATPIDDSKRELSQVVETFRKAIIDQSSEKEFYDLFLNDKIAWATVYEGKTKEKLVSENKYRAVISSSFKDFFTFLKSGKFEEKFYNVKFNIEKNQATIDFDYAFLKEGKIQNWGREYWTLLRVGRKWKITSVLWTTNLQEIQKCPFGVEGDRETSGTIVKEKATMRW